LQDWEGVTMKAALRAGPSKQYTAPPRPRPATPAAPSEVGYAVRTADHREITVGSGPPAFVLRVPTEGFWRRLWQQDAYRAGLAFVRGEFDIEGDIVTAIDVWSRQPRPPTLPALALSLAPRLRLQHWFQSRDAARRNIEFHYDRSNEFYRTFLDSRMVYSCAYFENAEQPLDRAQEAKLELVCRKLDLHPGEWFLDVGCGWGALVAWAVERHGVHAVGCTLSPRQHEAAVRLIGERGLADRARVELRDYRDVNGLFARMASVGMVEHVGRTRLGTYFRTLANRLEDSGLLLNHGIVRPSVVQEDPMGHFLQQRVFPGGELASLGETIAAAERAGLEVLDLENLRPHYALTCRAWVARLQANRDACLELVGRDTYRTWLLYLAASASGFSQGTTDVYQILLAKRSPAQRRHLTRRYMFQRTDVALPM
jgi:cyclopropane-fatty-acyl-phospholipid synthase